MSLTSIQNRIIPVFVAYAVSDEFGRVKKQLSVHRNKQDAEFATRNQGWYGGPGCVQHKHAIEDGLDLYVLADYNPTCFADVAAQREAEKQAKLEVALAKLTPEEIALIKGAK